MSQDDGRVALVSGGSHGIGAATVRRLAARGWDVSFCYRDDGPSVRQVEKKASELGVRVVAIQADVTDPAQVASWFRRAEDELGPVAAMVSCAGITRDLPLPLMAEDDWRAVIDGVFPLCLAAVSVMAKQRSGRIVAVSSVCGAYDHPAGGHDIFARPGIAGFVKALAGQTARFGINVNAVAPGLVAHDMADLVPERARGDLTETIAIRRFGDAAAVADLVAFLLSEEAADITGTVLEAPGVISLLTGATPSQTARRNGTCRPRAPHLSPHFRHFRSISPHPLDPPPTPPAKDHGRSGLCGNPGTPGLPRSSAQARSSTQTGRPGPAGSGQGVHPASPYPAAAPSPGRPRWIRTPQRIGRSPCSRRPPCWPGWNVGCRC